MISSVALQALRDAAGDAAVRQHEAEPGPGGLKLDVTLEPHDGDALARVVRALAERGLACVVRGGGTKLWLGNPPLRADVLLSTACLAGVDVLDADEGVTHVRAGTPVAELRAAAHARGWEIALDPARAEATVGGVIAASEVGPRLLGFGRPRDVVLGLEVVLGSGERTRCGGRVVKNVTGYDLAKLYAGSLGTLGVIEGAWLRLRARPERERVLVAAVDGESAAPLAATAARSPSARCVALVDARLAKAVATSLGLQPGQLLLAVELAGDAAGVEADETRLAAGCGASPTDTRLLDALRAVHGELPGAGFLRFRVSFRRSTAAVTLRALRVAGAEVLAYPESGLLLARFPLEPDADEPALARPLQGVAEAVRVGGGAALLEAAPDWAKAGRDAFGPAPASLPLLCALKERWDPAGVLGPGRFVAGL